ncbi:MAG: hypothetical protein J0I01_16095 [Stenotrophomonas nitritireducens]|uniref:hypothetical protein n=1 Tax=Stenotrophomonas nitritireducens TaxID=83617 RepID=UPI001AD4F07D|nr:hypothetical protein [Stenotrophomonas nitritireducens]MBN8793745.1 hypothetical protein [Stenotrophomonas nitritireducens]MBN8796184.1 hypothetical protein [Stenotrophomonas nitritireducens]
MNPQALLRVARRRVLLIVLAGGVPLALATGLLALRAAGFDAGSVALTLALLAVVAFATWRARRLDARWLVARLDAQPRFEDSADLLFAAPESLNPLQQRQRARIDQRLHATPPDLRPRWPWPRLLACFGIALLVATATVLWPRDAGMAATDVRDGGAVHSAVTTPPALRGTRLEVTPPAYTGQPPSAGEKLDARALQGSHLRWQLRFAPQPRQAWLQFHDGRRLPLQPVGDRWQAEEPLQRSGLYRIVTEPALADAGRAWRLEVVPDRPPQVKVIEPAQTLTQAAPHQRRWTLRFEASDDFGVAAGAVLELTTAKGSGENIDFQQRRVELAGSGPATSRRFAHDVDLAALGVGPGDEVVARLSVRDNRAPQPQEARSPSLILRLPSEQDVQTSDLEGAIKKVMPAYFRSQRQIIIDAEALLKQRNALDADTFIKRANAIGVDQRILRLRYGQFLGEEAEGGAKPPPTGDGPPTADAAASDHAHDDGHDHDHAGGDNATAAFGSATDVLSEYGHTHDHAEAATLLDPQTRAILKAALDQMWQSEGHLRQGHPDKALPYAYKALGFIKQVQQAERVYLARVGPELPPIDMARRMGGKRDGLGNRSLQPAPRESGDAIPVNAWRALATADAAVDLDTLSHWLDAHPQAVPDPLDIAAAIDELRQQPDCRACRQRLRDQLWPALPRAPGPPARRDAADTMGRRYLDALTAPQETAR